MMIKPTLVLACMCLGMFTSAICQNTPAPTPTPRIITDLQTPDEQNRKVTITQAPEISRLAFYYSENQRKQSVLGFRVRIFSEGGPSARQKGQDVRSRFFREYPGIEPYLSYDTPNYKVYVGDFRTKTDALRIQKRILNSYPNAIIVENININPQQ